MAIFNNSNVPNKTSKTESNTTIITSGAKIEGELKLDCSLYIDGELDGTITSSKDINVGKDGKIKGTIIAKRLVVQGLVEGSVDAEIVEVKALGHIIGEISSNEFIIEAKGIFEGNSVIKKSIDEPQPKVLPKKS